MNLFAPLALLVFLLPIMIGIILLMAGIRGEPEFSEPKCAKCRYDLRGFQGEAPKRCAECGADLAQPRAVRFGDYKKRPRKIWAGAALIASPLLLVLAIVGMQISTGGGRAAWGGRAAKSNAELIAALSASADSPTEWRELESRMNTGRLNNAEAAKAIDALIAFISKKNKGAAHNGPLTWSDGFVAAADRAGAMSQEQLLRLADAFYGPKPAIKLTPRIRRGQPARFDIQYAHHWNLPGIELVKALRSVKLKDGTDVPCLNSNGQPDKPGSDEFSSDDVWAIEGSVVLDVEPGQHELTFVIDVGLLKENTKPQIVNNKPGQSRHWPTGRARYAKEVVVPVTVVAQNEAIVHLVTDEALDPRKTGSLAVQSAKVTRTGKGVRMNVGLDVKSPQVPLSCDVVAIVDGTEHRLGNLVVHSKGQTGSGMQLDLPQLPASVTSIDLVLRPNVVHAERVPSVDRAWGGTLEIKGVNLERYDLQSEAAQQQP